jgi:hypothetical protein
MADPATVAARHTHKRCPDCDQILPASAFYRRPNGYLSAYCKPHQRQRGRAWHARHRPPGQPRRAPAHGADRNRLPAAPLLAAVRRYAQRRHLTLKELLGPQLDGAFDHAQAAGTISLLMLERFCDDVLGWHPRMLYGDAYDHAAFHSDSEASSQPRPTQRPACSRTSAP